MDILLIVLGALLVIASIGSGLAKLAKVPAVMESMKLVGVKPHQVPILSFLEISGGVGLIVGIWIINLGKLSALCLTFFFAGAVISHLRKKHRIADFGPALVIFMISVLSTVLQFRR